MKKILVVDDEPLLLSVYAARLRAEGFEVVTAADGQEAWELIKSGNIPDLLFTGIIMPRMTGFDLVRKMQADAKFKEIPVAISSHRGRDEDKKTAKELNVDDFIMQGVTPINEIVRRLKMLVGLQSEFFLGLNHTDDDRRILVSFLNQQQHSVFSLDDRDDIVLELEPQSEAGMFEVKLGKRDSI